MRPAPPSGVPQSAALQATLRLLLDARRYAEALGCDVWDFAVELQVLRGVGASHSDLRCLAHMGYIELANEKTRPADSQRAFTDIANLGLGERTCFVLTPQGVALAQLRVGQVAAAANASADGAVAPLSPPAIRPHWDDQYRELRLGQQVIKRFRLPAPNQQAILDALQEEGWPPRIDDPLPPGPEVDSKQRLHDTIKKLNRNQQRRLIHFRGDGTGSGVCWQILLPTSKAPRPR
jgi:hypothetical protein